MEKTNRRRVLLSVYAGLAGITLGMLLMPLLSVDEAARSVVRRTEGVSELKALQIWTLSRSPDKSEVDGSRWTKGTSHFSRRVTVIFTAPVDIPVEMVLSKILDADTEGAFEVVEKLQRSPDAVDAMLALLPLLREGQLPSDLMGIHDRDNAPADPQPPAPSASVDTPGPPLTMLVAASTVLRNEEPSVAKKIKNEKQWRAEVQQILSQLVLDTERLEEMAVQLPDSPRKAQVYWRIADNYANALEDERAEAAIDRSIEVLANYHGYDNGLRAWAWWLLKPIALGLIGVLGALVYDVTLSTSGYYTKRYLAELAGDEEFAKALGTTLKKVKASKRSR